MEMVNIKTTQNVDVNYEIASVGDRIVAALIDYLFITIYIIVSLIFTTMFSEFVRSDNNLFFIVIVIIIYLPVLLYDLLFEVFMNGQSLGKRFREIKVIKLDGSQPSIGSYLLRWLFRIIDISFSYGGIAMLTILLNGKGQRIGDIAAGTTVIRLKKSISLQDTIFKKVEEDYTGTFPQVESLSNDDIETIKEVIKESILHKDTRLRNKILIKAKMAIEKKMNVNTDMLPRAFLEVVVKDYNYYKGKI